MITGILRYVAVPALIAAAGSIGGCTSPEPPVDTFVNASVQPAGMSHVCPWSSMTQWLAIGTATGMMPTKVANGNSQGNGRVSAACTVHQDGSGFDIELNASLTGEGSVTIVTSGAGAVTAAKGATGVSATFEAGSKGNFSATDCTITFEYNGAKVPANPPVQSGQIWGHLSCPDLQRTDVIMMGADGGVENATCDGEADFLFEYCGT
jgi:hypothetical protein